MWRSQQKEIMRHGAMAQLNSGLSKFWMPKNFFGKHSICPSLRVVHARSRLWMMVSLEIHESSLVVSCSFACIIFLFEAYKPFKGISRWWMAGAVSEIYNNNDGFLSLFISLVCVCACAVLARIRMRCRRISRTFYALPRISLWSPGWCAVFVYLIVIEVIVNNLSMALYVSTSPYTHTHARTQTHDILQYVLRLSLLMYCMWNCRIAYSALCECVFCRYVSNRILLSLFFWFHSTKWTPNWIGSCRA